MKKVTHSLPEGVRARSVRRLKYVIHAGIPLHELQLAVRRNGNISLQTRHNEL